MSGGLVSSDVLCWDVLCHGRSYVGMSCVIVLWHQLIRPQIWHNTFTYKFCILQYCNTSKCNIKCKESVIFWLAEGSAEGWTIWQIIKIKNFLIWILESCRPWTWEAADQSTANRKPDTDQVTRLTNRIAVFWVDCAGTASVWDQLARDRGVVCWFLGGEQILHVIF